MRWLLLVACLLPALAFGSGDILGIKLGMNIDQARKLLSPLGESGGHPVRNGYKGAFVLRDTDYSSVAYKANAKGEIVWLTGFVRPGKEIAFTNFGDTAKAMVSATQAIWNFEKPAPYRLSLKGIGGKASVVSLISLEMKPIK